MKKLIAIAVVFVLAVGVAFAADVSAEVIGMTDILSGSSEDGSKVTAGGWPGGFKRGRVVGSGENDDGNFGAWFRFEAYGVGAPNLEGYAWWKPVDQIKLTIGRNGDGWFSKDGVTRWQYYQVGGDVGVPKENWAFGNSFYAGWDGVGNGGGALLEIDPIEPMKIWFGIPFNAGGDAKNVFSKLAAQVAYNLGSIGEVAITYEGDLNRIESAGLAASPSKLYAYFGIKAIESCGIDLGVGYYLPVSADKYGDDEVDLGYKVTVNKPVSVGLGVNFSAGSLGIKARVQGEFAGSVKAVGFDAIKDPTVFTADLMPFFSITDKVTAHLDTGLTMSKTEGFDAQVGWHIEPYVTVKASWWAPNLYAGIRFDSAGKVPGSLDDAVVNWSIPIAIVFAF